MTIRTITHATMIAATLAATFAMSTQATIAADTAGKLAEATAMSLIYTERCPKNALQLGRNAVKFFKIMEESFLPTDVARARSEWLLNISSGAGGWGSWCNAVEERVPELDILAMQALKQMSEQIARERSK